MKYVIFLFFILLFSCEKVTDCKICKTKLFVPGQAALIAIDTVCYDISEGFFYFADSIGSIGVKIIGCEMINKD